MCTTWDKYARGIHYYYLFVTTAYFVALYFNGLHAYAPSGHELWPGEHINILGMDVPSYYYQGYQDNLKEQHEKELDQVTCDILAIKSSY